MRSDFPEFDDADLAILPRADAQAAARAGFLADFGFDPDIAVAVVKVLSDGLLRAAELMRQSTFQVLIRPGMSEVEMVQAAELLAREAKPFFGPLVESLLLVHVRHLFEAEAITARARATGNLPGAREVAVGFADMVGFTRLGEVLPPEELARLAARLAKLTHEVVAPPVAFVKTIGDAVMRCHLTVQD